MQPNNDLSNLSGRVAIITGAGQGIGAAVARALAAAGARVAVNDINPDRAARIAREIRAAGGTALDIMGDVSNKFQCVNIIDSTRAEWGRLDILVNNAGIEPSASILKMDEWEWTRVIDVNLKGVFFMSQLVGRVMADENAGRGGVIATIGARPSEGPGRAAYAASKAGALAFTRECAIEYAAFGVRVNTVLPGLAGADTVAQTVLSLCRNDGGAASGAEVAAG